MVKVKAANTAAYKKSGALESSRTVNARALCLLERETIALVAFPGTVASRKETGHGSF